MAAGCKGLQFYLETGRLIAVTVYDLQTGEPKRDLIMFPGVRRREGLVRPAEAKRTLVPNYCPACGKPFILKGEHAGEPSCFDRKLSKALREVAAQVEAHTADPGGERGGDDYIGQENR